MQINRETWFADHEEEMDARRKVGRDQGVAGRKRTKAYKMAENDYSQAYLPFRLAYNEAIATPKQVREAAIALAERTFDETVAADKRILAEARTPLIQIRDEAFAKAEATYDQEYRDAQDKCDVILANIRARQEAASSAMQIDL